MKITDIAGNEFTADLSNIHTEIHFARRETTFDHTIGGKCDCGEVQCPPTVRTYAMIPELHEYRINGIAVSEDEMKRVYAELAERRKNRP